jgi:hypothetical protein
MSVFVKRKLDVMVHTIAPNPKTTAAQTPMPMRKTAVTTPKNTAPPKDENARNNAIGIAMWAVAEHTATVKHSEDDKTAIRNTGNTVTYDDDKCNSKAQLNGMCSLIFMAAERAVG